jgi:hypothetical protein
MHRAVLDAEAAPVACIVVNLDGNHWTVPPDIQEKFLPAKLNTYIVQKRPRKETVKHMKQGRKI